MTIDLRVNVDLDRYAGYRYETLDSLAEALGQQLDRQIDDAYVTAWTAEHWAADDRPMLETLVEA
jgi:hypothetical protein